MSKPVNHLKIWIALICLTVTIVSETSSQDRSLPRGEGVETVETACLTCHEADIIVEQRLDRTKWEKEVDKMIRWGTIVSNRDREAIIDYLSRHFGAAAKSDAIRQAALPAGKGVEKVQRACLLCHEADIIVEQRLNQKGWEKEVDKMIRWGTPLSPEDRQEVIDYLASHFAP